MREALVRKFSVGFVVVISCLLIVSVSMLILIVKSAPGEAATASSTMVARKAYDFVDSIGVNAHLDYPNYHENYYQHDNTVLTQNVNDLVTNLGVHHLRAAAISTPSWNVNIGYGNFTINLYSQMNYLASKGVQFTAGASGWHIITCSQLATDQIAVLTQAQCIYGLSTSDPSYPTTQIVMPSDTTNSVVSSVTAMKTAGIPIEALEGYNEYHTYIPSALAGKTWPQVYPANWEQVISLQTEKVMAPAASQLGLPLIGPSFVPDFGNSTTGCSSWPSYSPPLFAPSPPTAGCTPPPTQLDNLSSYVTYSNTHAYQSTYYSGPYGFLSGDNVLHWWDNVYPGKPKIFTEVGYQDGQFSPTVQEKYMQRLLFELFNAGVKRTYIYELLDEVGTTAPTGSSTMLGLAGFNADGSIRLKPVYTALQNTLKIVSDPNGANLSPADLGITVTDPSNGALHKTLLETSAGDYYLVLWNEKSLPSSDTDASINNVGISLANASNLTLFRPATGLTALTTINNTANYSLNVPDDIEILKITPVKATQTQSPANPTSPTNPASGSNGTANSANTASPSTGSTATSALPTQATESSTSSPAATTTPTQVLADFFQTGNNTGRRTAYLVVLLLCSVTLVVMIIKEIRQIRLQ